MSQEGLEQLAVPWLWLCAGCCRPSFPDTLALFKSEIPHFSSATPAYAHSVASFLLQQGLLSFLMFAQVQQQEKQQFFARCQCRCGCLWTVGRVKGRGHRRVQQGAQPGRVAPLLFWLDKGAPSALVLATGCVCLLSLQTLPSHYPHLVKITLKCWNTQPCSAAMATQPFKLPGRVPQEPAAFLCPQSIYSSSVEIMVTHRAPQYLAQGSLHMCGSTLAGPNHHSQLFTP